MRLLAGRKLRSTAFGDGLVTDGGPKPNFGCIAYSRMNHFERREDVNKAKFVVFRGFAKLRSLPANERRKLRRALKRAKRCGAVFYVLLNDF